MRIYPINFTWKKVDVIDADGVATRVMAMVPLPRYGNVAARQFAEGEEYTLAPVEERSMASHKQFFAAINDAFSNVPENIAYLKDKNGNFRLDEYGNKIPRWPTANHFRRDLLIMTNWCDVKHFDMETPRKAKELGTWIRIQDEFAKIEISGTLVIVKRAKSQSMPSMNKESFEASKKDVLDLAENLIEVPKGMLMREAGKAL